MQHAPADQVVFGYSDGHELLASSLRLSTASTRELLPHVDAAFEDEAAHYLVGTPLQTVDRYLLARIWPAPEVARPGAVWAHGLLLGPEAEGDWLTYLDLLDRPSFDQLWRYNSVVSPARHPMARAPESLLVGLGWGALGAPDSEVVVLWPNTAESESAMVAVLDSLPPSVRWDTAFRTRGRARLGSSRYPIQVASSIGGSSRHRDSAILDLRRGLPEHAPLWACIASGSAEGKELRAFVRYHADEYVRNRGDVAVIARIWASLRDGMTEIDILADLLSRFPSPTSVTRLRKALVGKTTEERNPWQLSERERLIHVLSAAAAYDLPSLNVTQRFEEQWTSSPAWVAESFERFLQDGLPVAADYLLDVALHVVQPGELERIESAALQRRILAERPDLLLHQSGLASVSSALAIEFLGPLARCGKSKAVAQAIVRDGRRDLVAAALASGAVEGIELLASALDANCDAPSGTLSTLWAQAPETLSRQLGGLRLTQQRATALRAFLESNTSAAQNLNLLLPLAASLRGTPEPSGLILQATFLKLALGGRGEVADALMRETFAPVHRALTERGGDASIWQILASEVPSDDWDRAGLLRRAVAARAETAGWTREQLERALSGAGEHGERIVDAVPKKSPFRKVLEGVVGGLAHAFWR